MVSKGVDALDQGYLVCPCCGSTNIEKAGYPVSRGKAWICNKCAWVFKAGEDVELPAHMFFSWASYGSINSWRHMDDWTLQREETYRELCRIQWQLKWYEFALKERDKSIRLLQWQIRELGETNQLAFNLRKEKEE